MKFKKVWMLIMFVFFFHMKKIMINISSFSGHFDFCPGGKNTVTGLSSFLSFFYWLDEEGYDSTVSPC